MGRHRPGRAALMAGNAASTIRVLHHEEDGCWWSECDQMPGFAAAGETLDEVKRLAEEAVRLWAAEFGYPPETPVCHLWGDVA